MKYGIAIFPQKHVQDLANSYRKRYDPHYALIPPHITLKEAFEMNDADLEKVVDHLEKVAKESQPFQIHFHKVSHFHPANNVIYLAVNNHEPIRTLHEKINSGILHHHHRFPFTPHLTIGQKMPTDELHDVYGSLRMRTFDLRSEVDRFHLLYQLENGSWSVYQSFVFQF